jgi:transposase-like protein
MVVELGKSTAQVARDLQLHESTLGRWVAKWRAEHGQGTDAPLRPADAARLAELEEANRQLELENRFLKKAAAFFARELPQG